MPNYPMTDDRLASGLKRRDEKALEALIVKYTPYVGKIVWNIVGKTLSLSDAEEIISDSFIALWYTADKINREKLKPYLGRIARNKAIDAIRRTKEELPLDEKALSLPCMSPEQIITSEERSGIVKQTVDALPEPDRSIFIRHYYLCHSTGRIAADMGINLNTVQSKLRRGRDKLKKLLQEGGYFNE